MHSLSIPWKVNCIDYFLFPRIKYFEVKLTRTTHEIDLIGMYTVSLFVFVRSVETQCLGTERAPSSPFYNIFQVMTNQ
jgi:hypothetical protein